MRPYALLIPVATTFALSAGVAATAWAAPAGAALPKAGTANPAKRKAGAKAAAVVKAPKLPPKATLAAKTAAPERDAPEPAARARAADDEPPTQIDPRWFAHDGRIVAPPPHEDRGSFSVHGEYELRFRANNELPLRPGLGSFENSVAHGQQAALYHWLRLRPVFQHRKKLKVVAEVDFPRGLVAGDVTEFVTAARDSYDTRRWYHIRPRKLYLEYRTPIGLFRIGHQTSHWGLGMLANDGDHQELFGDYRRGNIVERLLFATKPMGVDGPLTLALGADLVWDDNRARLLECDTNDDLETECQMGDRAVQGIMAARWEEERFALGVYGVLRDQSRDASSVNELTPFTESLQVGVVDVEARFNAPVPGSDAFLYAQLEAALIVGTTNYVRNVDLTAAGDEEAIRSFGGILQIGAARYAGKGKERYGDFVAQMELGYASGDANPWDGVSQRFVMNENHNVGLVLFDHVLAWKTARAATIAQDAALLARPSPGVQWLPSDGGVFGAAYINPTVLVRPKSWLDLKAGMVIAQTTSDFVDPTYVGTEGSYRNFDGGDATRHDLGVELDLGADVRWAITKGLVLRGGVEGGVLFPGGALAHSSGTDMPNQVLVNTKLGLKF